MYYAYFKYQPKAHMYEPVPLTWLRKIY